MDPPNLNYSRDVLCNPDLTAVTISLEQRALPLVIHTVDIAEQVRTRLMGIHRKVNHGDGSAVSRLFAGKAADGTKALGHEHLFILPLGNGKGRIDRILLRSGSRAFDPDEIEAILRLRELWQSNDQPVRCVATWKGRVGEGGPFAMATKVESTTPFVTVRHWRKGRGSETEFLMDELRRECRNHGLPAVAAVEPMESPNGPFEWIDFRRNRKEDPPRKGYGFRVEFTAPVVVPFSIGYGCHFGLGQFHWADRSA